MREIKVNFEDQYSIYIERGILNSQLIVEFAKKLGIGFGIQV